MRKARIVFVLALAALTIACTPVEVQAYRAIVAAKAFIDAEKKVHPECATSASTVCSDLSRATAGKDALIDAAEIYCSGPEFETGGKCQAPAKGTPGYDQAVAKLRAALAAYNQVAADLKGVL